MGDQLLDISSYHFSFLPYDIQVKLDSISEKIADETKKIKNLQKKESKCCCCVTNPLDERIRVIRLIIANMEGLHKEINERKIKISDEDLDVINQAFSKTTENFKHGLDSLIETKNIRKMFKKRDSCICWGQSLIIGAIISLIAIPIIVISL